VIATPPLERLLAGLPLSHHRLDIAGIRTRAFEAGRGPLVVLLHGAIESGGALWAPVVAQLAEQHHLLVPDLPGLGESEPAPQLDFATFAQWFDGLLDQTAFDGCALVAHSMGGSLAARYAVEHGNRLSQLVVYSGPAIGPYRIPRRLQYLAIRVALRPTPTNFDRFKRFALYDADATRQNDAEWFDAWDAYTRARARDPRTKKTMRQLVSQQAKPIDDADLDRIAVPTRLVWGRDDRMVPLAVAEHAATLHRWPLYVINRSAHAPHLERPSAFVATLNHVLGASRASDSPTIATMGDG
jgi:2-hydroxymuconate-semialdehyde hydrolase